MTVVASEAADLESLRAVVAEFFADQCGDSALRAAMETDRGYDAEVWRRLAGQLGVAGLIVPESSGGSGGGLAELAVVVEQSGRVLYGGPLLARSLATWALVDAGVTDHLTSLAEGQLGATVAVPHRSLVPRAHRVSARDGRLEGVADYVLHGDEAELIVVPTDDGVWLVEPTALDSVESSRIEVVDPTRPLAQLRFSATPARQIGDAAAAVRLADVAAVALACEQVGGAAVVLEETVAYVKVRQQFGQPIGAFQAVKHHCADVLLAVESARAISRRAVRAVNERAVRAMNERAVRAADDADPDLARWASTAKAWCSAAYVQAAETALQLHGGIGFTWEHSTQLHLKRAKATELLFGDPRAHRSRLGRLLGLS